MKSLGRRLANLSFLLVVCFAIAVIGGIAFNSFENWNLNRLYPVPGKTYSINGRAMHIYCIGQGSPTVILESGLGNDWLIWQKVQPQIAKTSRVCSYDRAGLGWSESRPGSRGALAIAKQLNALLKAAGINDELVLVGHSAGGLYVRAFTGLFPEKVVGLVLVEASSPENFHASPSGPRKELIAERHREAPWLFFKVATGLSRLTEGYCNPNTSQRIPVVEGLARAEDCRPHYMNSWLGEWDDFESSAEQVFKMRCCDSIPLVIISEDPGPPKTGTASSNGRQPSWDDIQESLKQLSSRSIRIIARNSRHYVMVDRPDVVVAAVAIIKAEVGKQANPISVGQTVWR